MSSISPIKVGNSSNQKYPDVSVVSLDALNSCFKLKPGEPHSLAPGVTISVLQSAAEGLLEIESEASISTRVDDELTSELATIRSGQIIKTSEGRFVMVRHLESFILPEAGKVRSPEVEQMIQMATASLPQKGEVLSQSTTQKPCSDLIEGNRFRTFRKIAVRSAIGLCAAVLIGAFFTRNSGEPQVPATTPIKATGETAKSRIVAATVNNTERTDAPAPSEPISTKIPRFVPPQEDKPVAASLTGTDQNADGEKRRISKTNQSTQSSSLPLVRLSAKDRETITEYKLEARFDRANARAKLKHLAGTFPPGSPARLEVEKAYNSL